VVVEQRVHSAVDEVIVQPLGFVQYGLAGQAQPLRNSAALLVLGGDANLDTMKLVLRERELDEHTATGRHDAASLELFIEPIADLDAPIEPVDLGEANDPRDPSPVPDATLKAVPVRILFVRGAGERSRILDRDRRVDPRKPLSQIHARGLDEREDLVGIAQLDHRERCVLVDRMNKHVLVEAPQQSLYPERPVMEVLLHISELTRRRVIC